MDNESSPLNKQCSNQVSNQQDVRQTQPSESQCETLASQLFDPSLLRLWRTGASFLAYKAEEDTCFVSLILSWIL